MTATIYRIVNLTNGHCYVGSTERDVSKRFKEHRYELNRGHGAIRLRRAWKKHGANSFSFTVLEHCSSKKRFKREQYWADKLNAYYNGRPCVDSLVGFRHSEETKKRIGEAARRRGFSALHRARISAAKRGVPKSEEHKSKLSAANMGKRMSSRMKEILRIANKGRKPTLGHMWINNGRKERLVDPAFGSFWMGQR